MAPEKEYLVEKILLKRIRNGKVRKNSTHSAIFVINIELSV